MTAIRRLDPSELPACKRLEEDRGWDTDPAKWRLMFAHGEVHAIDADDGDGLAGCVVLTHYGDDLTAVGMMLVADRYGRRGLGSTLMRHALEQTGKRSVELTATRFGRPVYERLGFRPTGTLTIHHGSLPDLPTPSARPATPGDHERILRLDHRTAGADRSAVLTHLLTVAEQTVVADDGFAIAWNAGSHRVIGPVVAPSEEVARDLVVAAARGADRPLRLDVLSGFPDLRAWIVDNGMAGGENELPTMIHGADAVGGDRARYVAPILISMG
ncbi:GNAT family N-acetyltransferase [Nonomuraea sp. NPDC050663]|uniref:GNAT family N-acetyltransferase n=1 Tax=Nonomuraea sp. NPDC050663 TaxID=3364370 RepID=UPI0037AACB00